MTPDEWDELAEQEILNLLNREHALLWLEIEARLAGRELSFGSVLARHGIEPHHLTNARHALTARRLITTTPRQTRGRSSVQVITASNTRGIATVTERASARKALLWARYTGWARPTSSRPSLLGAGGERVAHASLVAAASSGFGYQLDPRTRPGGISSLFNLPIPRGPVDLTAAVLARHTPMPVAVGILAEVKNIREWIYPEAAELYQLLDKASSYVVANPSIPVLPVLICRRAHYTTFLFAKRIGIFVGDARKQFILPYTSEVSGHRLAEVQQELAFDDLLDLSASDPLLLKHFENIQRLAAPFAQRFMQAAPAVMKFAPHLRTTGLPGARRRELWSQMDQELSAAGL